MILETYRLFKLWRIPPSLRYDRRDMSVHISNFGGFIGWHSLIFTVRFWEEEVVSLCVCLFVTEPKLICYIGNQLQEKTYLA